jgi:voltage-gated potassium channel Kch
VTPEARRRTARLAHHGRALSAMMRASDSYGLLLVLLLVDYFLLAGFSGTRGAALIRVPMVMLTLLLALYTSHAPPKFLRFAAVSSAFVVFAAVVYAVTGEKILLGAVNLLIGFLLISCPFFILRRILGHERVSTETILGSLCVYVLIGVTFATVFIAIDVLGPTNFATPANMNSAPDLLYLSFVTLTTVGYGDIVAAHDVGRAMLVLEAVIGQIFLITLVARLVAMFGEEQRKNN